MSAALNLAQFDGANQIRAIGQAVPLAFEIVVWDELNGFGDKPLRPFHESHGRPRWRLLRFR